LLVLRPYWPRNFSVSDDDDNDDDDDGDATDDASCGGPGGSFEALVLLMLLVVVAAGRPVLIVVEMVEMLLVGVGAVVPCRAPVQQVLLGLLESDARDEREQQPAQHGRSVPAEHRIIRQRLVRASAVSRPIRRRRRRLRDSRRRRRAV